jgi:omega-amidase
MNKNAKSFLPFSMIQPLRITLLQTLLHWQNTTANLNMLGEKISTIAPNTTDVIVLPEMFTSGFTMNAAACFETMNGKAIQWMQQQATKTNAVVCGSLIIKEQEKFYNRLVWMLPNGQYETYDKHHLFRLSFEQETYTAGSQQKVVEHLGWRINLNICYDLRFPVWCRQNPKPESTKNYRGEFDVQLFVANWPQRRATAWNALLPARAIENQCYVIGLNRVGNDGNEIYHSGNSAVYNALGECLFQQADEECMPTVSLSMDELIATRRTFQFWKDADEFQLL